MPDRYISKYDTWITVRNRVYTEHVLLIKLPRLQVPPQRWYFLLTQGRKMLVGT